VGARLEPVLRGPVDAAENRTLHAQVVKGERASLFQQYFEM
jgi:hypothetical protein